MKNIKDLLKKRPPKKNKEIDEKFVESVFFQVSREYLPNIARADFLNFKLQNKMIYLTTSHPAIAGEIWKKRERLKNEINNFLENEGIEEIKVK